MTEHDDTLYLAHIDATAALIERTALLRKRAEFDRDFELRDATMYRLQTLAESTQRVAASFKEAHPEIPWDDIAGFRNRAVHGYLTIDLDIVWDIVERDVSPLAECARLELDHRRQLERPGRDLGLGL